jgi:hypothetical protein
LLDLAQKAARAVAFDLNIGTRESQNAWSPELEAKLHHVLPMPCTAAPVEGLEQALTGPILDTYEVTRAAPGGVWVMRAMRAMRAMLAEVCSAPPDARAYARAAVHFLIAANKGGGSPSGHRDDREAACSSWWVQRR